MSKRKSNETQAANKNDHYNKCDHGVNWKTGKAIAPYWHANDGSWYTFGATLSPNILNWNTKLGNPTSWDLNENLVNGTSVQQIKQCFTPGIMTLGFLPTMGKLSEFNDAMNVAGRGLHTYIWHTATRSTSYDAADLMIYCGCADSLNAFYGLMCRLYGLLPTYGYNNSFYPEAAIYAQGFDPDSLRNNAPRFRSYINMFARKIGRFAVPASLPIFKRHNYLCSNVFKDDEDPDIYQTYIPMPEGFYKFGLDENSWGRLEFVGLKTFMGNPPWSIDKLFEYGDMLINALAFMPDMDAMSADVLQSMGAENCWGVSTIAEDYRTDPIYDEAFMMQTDNMDFLGALGSDIEYQVTQDANGVLSQTLRFYNGELYSLFTSLPILNEPLYTKKRIIWNKPTTSLEDVMELTRGVSFPMVIDRSTSSQLVTLEPRYASTEVWTTMKIVADTYQMAAGSFFHTYAGTGWLGLQLNATGSGGTPDYSGAMNATAWYAVCNSFKHHPMVRLRPFGDTRCVIAPDNRDLRHYATITDQMMEEINTQAVFSEWNVARSNFIQG